MKQVLKKYIFIAIITLSFTSAFAQKTIIDEETKDYALKGDDGPNLKNYSHLYYGYGFLLGKNLSGSEIKMPASTYFEIGMRYKRRIAGFLAVGGSFYGRFDFFRLRQNVSKTLPDIQLHKSETMSFYKMGIEPYIRINFDKRRGNYIGHYLDFGGRANWNYMLINETRDKIGNIKISSSKKGYSFYEPLYYEAFARIGLNKFDIIATYRLTNLFKSTSGFAELPLYSIGINVSSIKY